jgi:hypothetical protein
MSTACFARAPQRYLSRPYMHFLFMFHEVRPISKTRNQLHVCPWVYRTLGQLYSRESSLIMP